MSLSDIVRVTITRETSAPSEVGFGIPLVMSYHNVFPERARTYSDVDGMLDDGFVSTDPAVLKATALFAQNPKPPTIVVGREANTQKKKIRITPVTATLRASYDYIFYLNDLEVKFTTDATPTVAEITAGLKAAADLLAQPVTTTDGTTYLDVEANVAGVDFRLTIPERTLMNQKNLTTDNAPTGIVADITAVRAENDDWYTCHLCHQSKAVVVAAAAYIETLVRGMIVTSADDEIMNVGITDDVVSALQTAGYVRTMIAHHPKAETQHMDGAWAGVCLPYDPGSITWNFKTLTGVNYVEYTSAEKTVLQAKGCNYYTRISGKSITQTGITPGAEWFDVINGIDWTQIRMQEAIFNRLSSAKKVPFTDLGIAIVESEVRGILQQGVQLGIYAEDPAPQVEVPLAADVSAANKANRLLTGVTFRATLAGAIHEATISGTVSV